MTFDPNTNMFYDLEEQTRRRNEREWPLEPFDVDDDGDAGQGLAAGLLFAGLFWGCVGLWIFVPWSHWPLSVSAGLIVFAFVVFAAQSIVDRWRDAHPDSPIVDWLRRSGL